MAAVGDLDELSASLGLARVAFPQADDLLCGAQKALYKISAIVSAEARQIDIRLDDAEIAALEAEIDRASDALPPLRDFIYPGEAEASARLHMARAVARRAERSIAALEEPPPPDNRSRLSQSPERFVVRLGAACRSAKRTRGPDAGRLKIS